MIFLLPFWKNTEPSNSNFKSSLSSGRTLVPNNRKEHSKVSLVKACRSYAVELLVGFLTMFNFSTTELHSLSVLKGKPWVKSSTRSWELPSICPKDILFSTLYFGHGGGEQYICSALSRPVLRSSGADLLGAFRGHGDFDRTGIPCNYMLAAGWYVALKSA